MAINSPQILMRSGVGDSEEMKKHGIQVNHELKGVGKNSTGSFCCSEPIRLAHNL